MLNNKLDQIRSRPGMYLSTYDQKFDASGICVNFLMGIFDLLEFGCPDHVDITSNGPYVSISAIGCGLDFVTDTATDVTATSLFDFNNNSLSNEYPGLIYLTPIVWFSQYCLVDISINNKTHRQIFIDGSPIPGLSDSTLHDDSRRISFCFTLPESIFDEAQLNSARIKQVVSQWQSLDFARGIIEEQQKPEIHFNWCEQSNDNFSLRISASLDDEALWDNQFANSKDKLRCLAEMARADIQANKTYEMAFTDDGVIVPGT